MVLFHTGEIPECTVFGEEAVQADGGAAKKVSPMELWQLRNDYA